jgi:hypothetical protein
MAPGNRIVGTAESFATTNTPMPTDADIRKMRDGIGSMLRLQGYPCFDWEIVLKDIYPRTSIDAHAAD